MKKIKLLAGLFLLSLCGYSQAVSIGIRGGLSIPNIVAGGDNPLSKGYSSRLAEDGGLFAEMGLNNYVSFRLGVEYSGQGGKRNGVQAMPSGQIMSGITASISGGGMPAGMDAMLGQLAAYIPEVCYVDVKNIADFDYLMIPVSVQVGTNVSNRWRVYANAGPFVSFLLHGKQTTKGRSRIYTDAGKSHTLWDNIPAAMQPAIEGGAPQLAYALQSEMDFGATEVITRDLNPVNAGVQGDVGLSYRHDRHKVFVEAGGNYGFVKMQKDKSNGSNRIGAATVMLGYAFQLR
ncbi:MAG: PorT family protein [Prevotellaceae bacterium]|jgi:hypothetical protein|nr:PorT family protein [Prevotellaceae bacterium]